MSPYHAIFAHIRQAIAQLLPPSLVRGDIRYSGLTSSEALAKEIHMGHLVQYVEQLDQHLPFLTVRETFQFLYENALVDPLPFGHTDDWCEYFFRLSFFYVSMFSNPWVFWDVVVQEQRSRDSC